MSSTNPTQPTSWWGYPRHLLRRVLHTDDTPHAIALGAAIGMFIGWTPTVGIQMILVVIVAFLAKPFFRFNQFAGLVGVYVSNPVTTVPMYWLMYKVGTLFVPGKVTYDRFAEVLEYESFSGWCATLWALFVDIGLPLIIGSLVLATIFGLLTYPAMRWLLKFAGRKEPSSEIDEDVDSDEATEETADVAQPDLAAQRREPPNRAPAEPVKKRATVSEESAV